MSTDGGSTFANVIDGGVYSGATAGTLNLNVPASYWLPIPLPVECYSLRSTATSNAVTLTVNLNPTVSLAAAPFTALIRA